MMQTKKNEEAVKNLEGFLGFAKKGIPAVIFLLLIAKFVFHIPFSNWTFFVLLYLFLSVYILFRLKSEAALSFVIAVDMIVTAFLIYLFMPFLINSLGSIGLLVFISSLFYIGNIFNLSLERGAIFIFLITSSLIAVVLTLFEYFGIYPENQGYIVNNYFLKDKSHLFFSLLVLVGAFFFFSFHINNLLKILRDKIEELDKIRRELFSVNQSLEEGVRERTKELEEAKSVLEIKVQARKEELKILASNLEEQVKERTRALEKKAEELQEVNRSIVKKELDMIKLKREIKYPEK